MVSLKQSRWLVALDRNLVYGIMSVCPRCMCPYIYIYIHRYLMRSYSVLKVLTHRIQYRNRGSNFTTIETL